MQFQSPLDLLLFLAEATAWGALFMAVYRLYDSLLAKAGWRKN